MISNVPTIPLLIAVPLAGAFLAAAFCRSRARVLDGIAILTTLLTLILALQAARLVGAEPLIYAVGGWAPPFGIALVLDGLSAFMAVIIAVVAFLVAVFSADYMERFTSKWQFYCMLLLMLAGTNGVVLTGDLFNMFVFLELAAVVSYALVAFGTEKRELEAAFKYAVMSKLGTMFILLGIAIVYANTSTLNMIDVGRALADTDSGGHVRALVAVLFIVGFGLKAALVPFHAWLPDAHPSAPAPISAMLSGVLIKALGVYPMCRILFNVLGFTPGISAILMILGALSMLVGVFLAIGQWDLKRLLAYHSISQIGYVILGIGLGTPLGIFGGLFHLLNHSLFKSLLFLSSGSIEYATGARDLRKMGGLAGRLPVTSATTFLAAMSIAGVPPFAGFWSKMIIILACVQQGRHGYALCAVVASILTLASFVKVLKYAFYGESGKQWPDVREVPALMKLAMGAMAILCISGGLLLLPQIQIDFLESAAAVLTQGVNHATIAISIGE